MDIASIKTRLAEIESAIPGVSRAYTHAPSSIPEGDLPVCINFIGKSTHDQESGGERTDIEVREFTIRLYVCMAQQGISGEAEEKVEPFILPATLAFLARPSLSSNINPTPLPGVRKTKLIADSGVTLLSYGLGEAVNRYLGIEIKLQVEYVTDYTFAQNE